MCIFIGLCCLWSSEKLGRYGAHQGMQETVPSAIPGLKSLSPHGSVNQQKMALPCPSSIWNFHNSLDVDSLLQALSRAGHPPGLFPIRLASETLIFLVLLQGFTPGGPVGNDIYAFPVVFLLCCCPEHGCKCITDAPAENLRLSAFPSSL